MRALAPAAVLLLSLAFAPLSLATADCASGTCVWDHVSHGAGDCTTPGTYDANGAFVATTGAAAGAFTDCGHNVNPANDTDVRGHGLYVYVFTPEVGFQVGWFSQTGVSHGQDVSRCDLVLFVDTPPASAFPSEPCPAGQQPPMLPDLP
jgi:hypothetical protein